MAKVNVEETLKQSETIAQRDDQDKSQRAREGKAKGDAQITKFKFWRKNEKGQDVYAGSKPIEVLNGLDIEDWLLFNEGSGVFRVDFIDANGRLVTRKDSLSIGNTPTIPPGQSINGAAPSPTIPGVSPHYLEAIVKAAVQQSKPPASSEEQLLKNLQILNEIRGNAQPQPQKSLLEQLKELREIERLIAPKPEPVKAKEPVELTTQAAILKLVGEDQEQLAKVTERLLFGNESKSDDSMPAWLQTLIPLAAPLIQALTQKLLAPAEPQATQTAQPPLPPAQPQQPPPQMAMYQHAIGRIFFAIENGLAADFIGEEIGTLAEKDATLAQMIEPLIATPVDTIQAQLSQISPQAAKVMTLPHAKEWLAELQAYFTDEPENGVDSSANAKRAVG